MKDQDQLVRKEGEETMRKVLREFQSYERGEPEQGGSVIRWLPAYFRWIERRYKR